MPVGVGGGLRLAGILQRVAEPQGDSGVLGCAVGRLAQQRCRLGVARLHPACTAQPGQRFGVVVAQLQGTRGGVHAGRYIAGLQFGIGQHDPGDEIGRLALHRQAQLLPVRIHPQVPAASCASSSAWCSWISRSTSVSSSPAMMLGRSYRVSPSTRWSVMRPWGKL